MMATPLDVLIIEDNLADAELMQRALSRAGFDPIDAHVVASEHDFRDRLQSAPDIILADFTLPGFSALGALETLRECKLDIPCIIVSGSIGEERAVQIVQQGADDYIMKGSLGRLGQAVKQSLDKKELRDAMREADQLLRHSGSLLTLSAEVAIALTKKDTLAEMLHHCAESLIRGLEAAFVRIWTCNIEETVLEPRASAWLDGQPGDNDARAPQGQRQIELIAEQRQAYSTNAAFDDPRVGDRAQGYVRSVFVADIDLPERGDIVAVGCVALNIDLPDTSEEVEIVDIDAA